MSVRCAENGCGQPALAINGPAPLCRDHWAALGVADFFEREVWRRAAEELAALGSSPSTEFFNMLIDRWRLRGAGIEEE